MSRTSWPLKRVSAARRTALVMAGVAVAVFCLFIVMQGLVFEGATYSSLDEKEKIGTRINHMRVDHVKEVNPDLVAAACPFCLMMIKDGLADKDLDEKIKQVLGLFEGLASPSLDRHSGHVGWQDQGRLCVCQTGQVRAQPGQFAPAQGMVAPASSLVLEGVLQVKE